MAKYNSADDIIISYCIPVLNRADDLIATLEHNLSDNLKFMGSIEFLIIIFDKDDHLYELIVEKYEKHIESRYLRIVKSKALIRWHFGRAKNAFKPYTRGRFYSSLDADNFVTAEETEQILEIYKKHKDKCIIHHFRGVWGDGSCGRVTVPSNLYYKIGYDDSFMPRQFDEIDFILTVLSSVPNISFITYFDGGFLSMSKESTKFLKDAGHTVRNIVIPAPKHVPPLNPKSEDYASRNVIWNAMLGFNRFLSFAHNASSSERAEEYLSRVTEYGYKLVDRMSPRELLQNFFNVDDPKTLESVSIAGCIPVFAVMKDEEIFLRDWYNHYVSMGCGPFFLVDDGSVRTINETIDESSVFVFRPNCGDFRTCKTVWISALMKIYLSAGCWALTVDADEFLDVPECFGGKLSNVVESAEEKGQQLVPGLLVDMVPEETNTASRALASGQSFLKIFSHHYWDEYEYDIEYGASAPVQWAFGAYWPTSSRIDIRYRLFGTIDVLRKIPLIRYSPTVVLNQGYHDVRNAKTGAGVRAAELWADGQALPIRHYRLVHLFSEENLARTRQQSQVRHVYHARTTDNLRRATELDTEELARRLSLMPIVRYLADRVSECRRVLEKTMSVQEPSIPLRGKLIRETKRIQQQIVNFARRQIFRGS